MLSNMGSFLDAPADATALQHLFEANAKRPVRFRFGYLFGANPLGQPGGYWFDHANAVRVVARQLQRLVNDGYIVVPQLMVPGTQDDLVDFLVISPRGSVYAIIAHEFSPNHVRMNSQAVLSAGRSYAYPGDLRAKADEVSLRLQLKGYPHTEVIPMLVAVNTARFTTRGSGRVKGATDYSVTRKIRKREDKRMRLGFDVQAHGGEVFRAAFWQDTREFLPEDHTRNVRLYRRLRRLSMLSYVAGMFWSQLAFGLIAGGVLAALYYMYTASQIMPNMIMGPN